MKITFAFIAAGLFFATNASASDHHAKHHLKRAAQQQQHHHHQLQQKAAQAHHQRAAQAQLVRQNQNHYRAHKTIQRPLLVAPARTSAIDIAPPTVAE